MCQIIRLDKQDLFRSSVALQKQGKNLLVPFNLLIKASLCHHRNACYISRHLVTYTHYS